MSELNTERLLFWFHKDESGKPIWKDAYVYAVTERDWKSVMHEGKTVI